ncbi:MAG: hypothetical protein GSR78_04820 [Desulfurococcales archaeon]|nr:hypothetical protein [Desulfurococcales archaeon]
MRRLPSTYRRGVATVVGAIIALSAMIALALVVTQAFDERMKLAEERLERAREDLKITPIVNATGVYAEVLNRGYVDTVIRHILVVNRSSGQIIYHATPQLRIDPGNMTVFRLGDWSSGRIDIAVVTQRGSVFRWDPELTVDGVLDLPGEPVSSPAALEGQAFISIPPETAVGNNTLTLLSGVYDGRVIVYPEPLVSYTSLSVPDLVIEVVLDDLYGYMISVNGRSITAPVSYPVNPLVIGNISVGEISIVFVEYYSSLYAVFTYNGSLVELAGNASASVRASMATNALPGSYSPIATAPLLSNYANVSGSYTLDFNRVNSSVYAGRTIGYEEGVVHGNFLQVFSYNKWYYDRSRIYARALISLSVDYARVVTVSYTLPFAASGEFAYWYELVHRSGGVYRFMLDYAPRDITIQVSHNGTWYVRHVLDRAKTWSYAPASGMLRAALNPVMPVLSEHVVEYVGGAYPWRFTAYTRPDFKSYTVEVRLVAGQDTVVVYLTPSLGVELGSVESVMEDLGGCWGSMTLTSVPRSYTGCPAEPGLYVVGWYDPGSLVYTVQPVGVS